MSDVLIKSEHVSKKFCRSLKRSLWYGVKDVTHSLNPWAHSPEMDSSGDLITKAELRPDEFWALQDINFEVRRGECLGLIGHNGAGKSTLLKILNGLIRPDSGRITMRGRVGALIELSAGFNPILTGRENIYNQAALLGFSKKELGERFDSIVEFSELEPFLDMPLQNYSSGMKVKLGFAVAAHTEPDILLVDEVLAVGDLGFRYKCLNKIGDLLKTCAVVFVSHSMTQVMRVASQIMLLKEGRNSFSGGEVTKGLEAYFDQFNAGRLQSTGSGEVQLNSISVKSLRGECELEGTIDAIHGESLHLSLSLNISPDIDSAVVQVLFWNHEMLPVLDVIGENTHGFVIKPDDRYSEVSVKISGLQLNSGRYYASVIVTSPNLDRVFSQTDHAFTLLMSGGSPASGAGCVVAGQWQKKGERFAKETRELLEDKLRNGHKLSPNDTFIFRELRKGDVAIDCGANVGLITTLMANTGAEVHAFEPDPAAFAALKKSVHNRSNVQCHNLAVSDSDGLMKLYFRGERNEDPLMYSVGSTLVASKCDVDQTTFAEVRVIRLSQFLKQFTRIRILKLDIEGAECDVLEDLIRERVFDRIDLTLVETHEEWIPETIPRLTRIRALIDELNIKNVYLNWI